jgi:serine/threonine protein kinase
VLDFGIAKLVGDQVGVKTHTSAVMGTPAFMSPEQCRGAGRVDHRRSISLSCFASRRSRRSGFRRRGTLQRRLAPCSAPCIRFQPWRP